MQKVTVTRMELLAKREQIELARQGLEMIKQKRAALLRELMRIAERALIESDALTEAAYIARRALILAETRAGPAAVKSAALAARGELAIEVQTANVMGVKVPAIEQKPVLRSFMDRGYAITGTSVTIDEAAAAFEIEVDSLLKLAESELRLKRLADEIQRTSRRANALEHVIIPRLQSETNFIQLALDERERSDHFRLKLVKRVHQRKKGK